MREMADTTEANTVEEAARAAAQQWLQHVDSGAWSTAWNDAAPLLREDMTAEQWESRGAQARRILGPLRSRRLIRAQQRDSVRQASRSGPFVLLRYRSTFRAGLYVETILTARTDDAWTVASYEVAPIAAAGTQDSTAPRP